MDTIDFTRFFLSFGGVLLLIWLCALLAKHFGLDKRMRGTTGQGGRLSVSDMLHLDARRKLLVVRVDSREYLLLMSGETVTVIDKLSPTHE